MRPGTARRSPRATAEPQAAAGVLGRITATGGLCVESSTQITAVAAAVAVAARTKLRESSLSYGCASLYIGGRVKHRAAPKALPPPDPRHSGAGNNSVLGQKAWNSQKCLIYPG